MTKRGMIKKSPVKREEEWGEFASKRQPLASGLILPDASHATVSFASLS